MNETTKTAEVAVKTAEAEITNLLNLSRFQIETVTLANLIPVGTHPTVTVKMIQAFRGKLAHMARLSAESSGVTVGKVRKGRDGEPERMTGWKAKAGDKIEAADCLSAEICRLAKARCDFAKAASADWSEVAVPANAGIRDAVAQWAKNLAS